MQRFTEAVEELRLPKSALGGGKKGEKKKKDVKYEAHHIIEKIDLSGFKYKRFSRAGM